MRRTVTQASGLLLFAATALLLAAPAFSFLPQFTAPAGGGSPGMDHWDFSAFPVVWSLNPQIGGNIQGSRSVADVMQASFNTWTGAPNTALGVGRAGDTSLAAPAFDGINLICFVCSGDFSRDAETLGVTITTVSNAVGEDNGHGGRSRFVGQILDADILFNPSDQFSTGGGSAEDLQTVATHEVGHFFGLDHTGVVRAVMFPFAPGELQTLSYDDVAGISRVYPKSAPNFAAAIIAGNVHFAGGAGIFGAHVFAESVTGAQPLGSIRKTPVSTLTLPDGSYRIEGLPADSYMVVAEPLDEPATAKDVAGYASAFGQPAIQTGFSSRWH